MLRSDESEVFRIKTHPRFGKFYIEPHVQSRMSPLGMAVGGTDELYGVLNEWFEKDPDVREFHDYIETLDRKRQPQLAVQLTWMLLVYVGLAEVRGS